MTTPSPLLAYREEPVHGPRHRAAYEQQVPLRVHLHDAQAQLREVARSHMARHPLAFDNARRVSTRRYGPRLAVPRVAVGLRSTAEVMAVHDPLEPTALGHARDLHPVALGEDRDGHRLPGLGRVTGHGEAPAHPRRDFEPGFLHVPRQGLRGPLGLLGPEAELDLGSAHLHHGAWTRFDDGDGHMRAFRVEHAGHAELSSDQTSHGSTRP